MKELSKIALEVHASTTMAIDSLYKQMKAEGQNVIGFAAGEPDFPTPDHVKRAAVAAIEENFTRYTPAAGTLELRRAVCERLRTRMDLEYDISQVVISSGAKHIIYLALRAIVNPGDEVILPTPAWVSFYELIKLVGGIPVTVHATEAEHFKLTPEKLERAITPRTKAIILNNPSNPTGMLYNAEQLQALTAVCVKHDLYILADEIYSTLIYDDEPFTSVASLGEEVKARTILINGVSKAFSMTGWRIGYGVAPKEIATVMSNYVSHSTGSPCAVSQKAAYAALAGPQDYTEVMQKAFEERRNYMVERMNAIPNISCIKPEGAFYVMMNMEKLIGKTLSGYLIQDDNDFATAFLKSGLVALVPGSGFDAPNFLRWSYASSMENIREGLDRLERFVNG